MTDQETQVEQKPEVAKPPKKERVKKLTRSLLLIEWYKEGITDPEVLATKLEEVANSGKLYERLKLRKMPPSHQMWLQQVKWYIHDLKKKGKIDGPVNLRGPRKKKEKVEAAPAQAEPAPQQKPAEEEIGTL